MHPIARLRGNAREQAAGRRDARDPMHVDGEYFASIERGMVAALHDNERVAIEVLSGDEPWQSFAAAAPADPEPLPLAERVVRESIMMADRLTGQSYDGPRRARQIPGEKIAKRPFADEAYAGRVLLRPRRNALLPRKRAHIALVHFAERKERRRELLLRELMKEVRLVLA